MVENSKSTESSTPCPHETSNGSINRCTTLENSEPRNNNGSYGPATERTTSNDDDEMKNSLLAAAMTTDRDQRTENEKVEDNIGCSAVAEKVITAASNAWPDGVLAKYEISVNSSSKSRENQQFDLSSNSRTIRSKRRKGFGPLQRRLREERSEKRCKGECYERPTGKQAQGRPQRALLESCRSKCRTKLASVELEKTYRFYRKLASRNLQREYLSALIIVDEKQREHKNNGGKKNRQITVKYKFNVRGEMVDLCKCCFSNIYGERPGFINYLVSNKKNQWALSTRTKVQVSSSFTSAEDIGIDNPNINETDSNGRNKNCERIEKNI